MEIKGGNMLWGMKLKGQFCRFSTLSLSIRITDIKWKLQNIFECFLCLWDAASESLVLPRTSDITGSEELQTVYLVTFPSHSRQAAPCFLWEEFQALANQKPFVIENYAVLNKRHVLMQSIATMETWQVLFACDAMHPGTCRHGKNCCVSRIA